MAFEDFVRSSCLHTSLLKNSAVIFGTICSFDTWRYFFFMYIVPAAFWVYVFYSPSAVLILLTLKAATDIIIR